MGIFEDLELLFHSSLSSDSRELYQWLISKRNSSSAASHWTGPSNCCLIIRNCPHFVFISLAVPEVKDRHSTSCSKIAIWPSNGRNPNLSSWAAQGEVKVQLNFWSLRCHWSLISRPALGFGVQFWGCALKPLQFGTWRCLLMETAGITIPGAGIRLPTNGFQSVSWWNNLGLWKVPLPRAGMGWDGI